MKRVLIITSILFYTNQVFCQPNDNQLFNAFKQGIVQTDSKKAGNCATVAIIKAAIGTFGINRVFKLSKNHDINIVTFKDGKTIELTDTEIVYAAKKSMFIAGDTSNAEIKEIFNYAQLCFAVLCKNYQIKCYSNKDYAFVVDKLNEGYNTSEIHKLLGLKARFLNNNPSYETLKPYKNLVLWNSAHAVYYSDGFYDEAFIENILIEKIENLKVHHCSVGGWFRNGCKPRGAYQLIE